MRVSGYDGGVFELVLEAGETLNIKQEDDHELDVTIGKNLVVVAEKEEP